MRGGEGKTLIPQNVDSLPISFLFEPFPKCLLIIIFFLDVNFPDLFLEGLAFKATLKY